MNTGKGKRSSFMSHQVTDWVLRLAVLLFAVTIHEYAHGRVAYSLGDPTAKRAGRLTLNPISHIDPLGALCLFLFRFGWAKPVPVDTRYFRNPRSDTIMMSLAGPLSNFAAALLGGLLMRFFLLPSEVYLKVLLHMILMNTGLGLFNLLPIPPLDGSHVLENLLPPAASFKFRKIGRYGPLFFLGILMADSFLEIGLLGRVLAYPLLHLAYLFGGNNFLGVLSVM
jgi:Zn-dependent protease